MDLLLAYLAEIKRRSVHTYINTLSKTQSPSSHRLTLQPQLPQWRERESIWPHATFQFSIVTLANKNQQVWSLIFPSKKKRKERKSQLRSAVCRTKRCQVPIQCPLQLRGHMWYTQQERQSLCRRPGAAVLCPSWPNIPNAPPPDSEQIDHTAQKILSTYNF